jgi:hypothetical protein
MAAKRKKKAVDRPIAVEVFRSAASRYPPRSWWAKVAEVVGEKDEDIAFWRQVVFYYVGVGWNPTNVDNMLQFYRRGETPGHPEMKRENGPGAKTTIDLTDQRDAVMISI